MAKIKAVFFDAGGVIMDWRRPVFGFRQRYGINSNEKWRKGFTRELIDKSHKGEIGLDEYVMTGLKRLGMEDKYHELRAIMPGKFKPIREVLEVIETIQADYLVGMISNIHKGMLDEWFLKHGYKELFDIIVDSSVLGMVKPEKEIYLLAIKKAKVKPEECLFIDDLEENVDGAEAVGMETIWFKDRIGGVGEIKRKLEIEVE